MRLLLLGQLVRSRLSQWIRPPSIPIHKLPSRAPKREVTLDDGKCCPSGGVHGTNRTPSKRSRPPCVPIHKYPSVVCAIAFGEPPKTPSSTPQACSAYSALGPAAPPSPTTLHATPQ